MSLQKAIDSGKEHRKPYYRSGRFDQTCRPNGKCPYCQAGRAHKHERRLLEFTSRIQTNETTT